MERDIDYTVIYDEISHETIAYSCVSCVSDSIYLLILFPSISRLERQCSETFEPILSRFRFIAIRCDTLPCARYSSHEAQVLRAVLEIQRTRAIDTLDPARGEYFSARRGDLNARHRVRRIRRLTGASVER